MTLSSVSSNVSMPEAAQIGQPNGSPVNTAFDPFDLARLRVSQDFIAQAGVKKLLTTVPVRKPSREWFVRTHPDQEYHFQTFVIELKEDSEVYLVDRTLWPELASESTFSPKVLITTANRQGVITLWPIRLPGSDGRLDDWNRSALEAAKLASQKWIRIQANRSLGSYEVFEASGNWDAPDWNVPSFQELLRIAFKE